MNLEKRTPIVLKTKQMFLIIFYAKFKMALWRVLGIDKCGALTRAAAKHTPQKSKQRNDRKTKPKARRCGAVPAEPLRRRLPLFPPRNAFLSLVFAVHCTS